MQSNKATVQKMVNALLESLNYIQTHSAAQIAAVVPAANYGAAGKTAYEQALANEIGMFSPTGLMPADGPQSVDRVLSSFDPNVEGHTVDVSQTYTDSFVQCRVPRQLTKPSAQLRISRTTQLLVARHT